MTHNGMEHQGPSSQPPIGTFIGGALIGGLIGAVVGLLFAPKSGTETRQQLGEGVHDLQEKANRALDDLKIRSEEVLGQTKQAVEGKLSLLSEAIDAGRKAASDVRKEYQERQEG